MNQETLMELGDFLNNNLRLDTCDNSLKYTHTWLEMNYRETLDEDMAWLDAQGITCDCDVVTRLYIPAKAKESNAAD